MHNLLQHKRDRRAHKHVRWKWVAIFLLAVALAIAWFLLPVGRWAEALQAWIDQFGPWGPLIFGVTEIPFVHYVAATFIGIIPGTLVNVYVGAIGGIASSGQVGGPLQWGFLAAGLVVSVIVVWIVTRRAKQKLSEAGVAMEE
jgi:uncharacterized membrane protein YdjX (TVP38/TMEM64 family)